MTDIGKLNELKVVRKVDFGFYLDGGNLGEILIPKKYVPDGCKLGDRLKVFIYNDSEDRIIATTLMPDAMVGEFAYLKVVAVNSMGAFLDWGLPKDLLVPFREQKMPMKEGRFYLVRIYLDERTNRIVASLRLNDHLGRDPVDFQELQEVDLLICDRTELGYKAIINNAHWGLIYADEVFQPLKMGQRIKGFVRKIRDDNKINLCLQKPGYGKVKDIAGTILETLEKEGGFIAVTDKSSPETIYKLFGISKKTYKKAIGAIYKKRLITIAPDGIKLIDKSSKK